MKRILDCQASDFLHMSREELLYAIAHTIHEAHPDYKIVYIKGDAFTDDLIRAIREGQIDAGVWNLDEILESGYTDLNMVPIPITAETGKYSSAAFVVSRGNEEIAQLLRQSVRSEKVRQIQQAVRDGELNADY